MNEGSIEFCLAKEKALERALASTCNEEEEDGDDDDDKYQTDEEDEEEKEEEDEQQQPKTSKKRTKLPDSCSNFSMTQQYLMKSKKAKSSNQQANGLNPLPRPVTKIASSNPPQQANLDTNNIQNELENNSPPITQQDNHNYDQIMLDDNMQQPQHQKQQLPAGTQSSPRAETVPNVQELTRNILAENEK